MRENSILREEDRLERPLCDAVDAVRAERIPDAAVERSISRALRVPMTSAHDVPLSKPHQPPGLVNRRRWLVVTAGTVAAVVVAGILWFHSPESVLADVAKAVAEQPWMRAVGKGPDGVQLEMWFSPKQGIFAARQTADQATETVFANVRQKTIEVYATEESRDAFLSRMPMAEQEHERLASRERNLEKLFFGNPIEAFQGESFELLSYTRETVRDGGETYIEYRFTTSTGSDDRRMVTILRVDPRAGLPVSWKSMVGKTLVFSCMIDYPDRGPQTIYALDVPRDVEVVDQTPGEDLECILAAWKAGRTRFDSYRAVVVQSHTPDHHAGGHLVYQVWRKGLKWRVELLRMPPRRESGPLEDEVPADAEPKRWWLRRQDRWKAVPKIVSDGTVEIHLQVIRSNPARPDPENPRYVLIKSLEPHKTNAFMTSTADPAPADRWFMPEFRAYPFPFGRNGFGYKRRVDTHPTVGPEGTVLLESLKVNPRSNRLRGARYWVDPTRNYVVRQIQWLRTGRLEELPNGVVEMKEMALSPSGLWYPRVVRKVQGAVSLEDGTASDTYYRYYVDFAAEIPDELFDVQKWGPIQ